MKTPTGPLSERRDPQEMEGALGNKEFRDLLREYGDRTFGTLGELEWEAAWWAAEPRPADVAVARSAGEGILAEVMARVRAHHAKESDQKPTRDQASGG